MAYSLEEMEAYLSEIYSVAAKDLEKTARQYLKDFERLQKQNQKKVDNGKWTQEEYDTWRKNKLLYGEHWPRIIQKVQREMLKVNQTALDYVNGKVPQIFAHTYNEVANKIPKSPVSGYSFELVNSETVNKLVKEEGIMLPPKKNLDKQKDKLWNAKQLNAQILQGVLTGESIPKLAERVKVVVGNNEVAAVRTARTMCTAAENSGRQSAYNKAEADGIKLNKTWLSAYMQANTRDTHRELNEQTVRSNEMFLTFKGNELEFPGDWRAPGYEVYNCRCTMVTSVIGFDKDKLKESVERQKKESEAVQNIEIESQNNDYWTGHDDSGIISMIEERRNNYEQLSTSEQDELIHSTGRYIISRASVSIQEINSRYDDLINELQARSSEQDKIYYDAAKIRDILKPEKLKLKELIDSGKATQSQIDRYQEVIKQLTECNRIMDKAIMAQIPIDDERRELIRLKSSEIEKAMCSLLAEVRACGGKISNRNIGLLDKNNYEANSARDMITDVLTQYPAEWVTASKLAGKILVDTAGRGYYNHYLNELVIEETNWSGRSTAYHELGHRFEFLIPNLAEAEKRFYERRTDGEELVKLNDVIANGGYGEDEVTKVDNFLNAYTGKYYNGEFFEVVSMGFEDFFTNPERLMKDNDYAEFICGVLCLL